jgi:hypothetical protein
MIEEYTNPKSPFRSIEMCAPSGMGVRRYAGTEKLCRDLLPCRYCNALSRIHDYRNMDNSPRSSVTVMLGDTENVRTFCWYTRVFEAESVVVDVATFTTFLGL